MQREQVMQALFNKLVTAAAFKTTGRRLIHWSKVAEQPALFLVEGDEEYPGGPGIRPRQISIDAEAWVYSNFGKDPNIGISPDLSSPASELNSLIDAIETVLKPPIPFRQPQTLGIPAVIHCRIEGKVLKDPGHLSGQAMAIVPIRMLTGELE